MLAKQVLGKEEVTALGAASPGCLITWRGKKRVAVRSRSFWTGDARRHPRPSQIQPSLAPGSGSGRRWPGRAAGKTLPARVPGIPAAAAAPGRAMGLMPAARASSRCRACPRPPCRLPACCAPAAPGRGGTGCGGPRGLGVWGPLGAPRMRLAVLYRDPGSVASSPRSRGAGGGGEAEARMPPLICREGVYVKRWGN